MTMPLKSRLEVGPRKLNSVLSLFFLKIVFLCLKPLVPKLPIFNNATEGETLAVLGAAEVINEFSFKGVDGVVGLVGQGLVADDASEVVSLDSCEQDAN